MPTKRISSARVLVFLHDITMIPIAWLGAYWLKFNLSIIPSNFLKHALIALPIVLIAQTFASITLGLYRGIWRFSSLPDLLRIFKAVIVGMAIAALSLFILTRLQGVPRSVFPLYAMLLVFLWGGSRFIYRLVKEQTNMISEHTQRVLIVGAGNAGESLARELLKMRNQQFYVAGFVDDRAKTHGQAIHGIRVLGQTSEIAKLVAKYNIQLILIAIPSIRSANMRRIVSYCENAKVPFRTLPTLSDLTSGRVTVNTLRDVSLDDLLGRDPVNIDWQAIGSRITEHTVLVTGGGGSIGAELCRQIAKLNPERLIVIENCEYNLYKLEHDLHQEFPDLHLIVYLQDVTDRNGINTIFAKHQPEFVFHAAAYKHVPLLETQLHAAIHNNLMGSENVARAADQFNTQVFVLISTDKAVRPGNIMGATKRAAEVFCQNFNAQSDTHFITVRFGNVLGSTGSVVPLFKQQLQRGGPLTVTHPDVTRYFMTIKEAAQLILQAAFIGQGGEIFVLDMGESIKINYLAEQMIRLSGKEIGHDIEIQYIGLRPGEKLHEELFLERESLMSTVHEKILKAQHLTMAWSELEEILVRIKEYNHDNQTTSVLKELIKLVPEYRQQVDMNLKKESLV